MRGKKFTFLRKNCSDYYTIFDNLLEPSATRISSSNKLVKEKVFGTGNEDIKKYVMVIQDLLIFKVQILLGYFNKPVTYVKEKNNNTNEINVYYAIDLKQVKNKADLINKQNNIVKKDKLKIMSVFEIEIQNFLSKPYEGTELEEIVLYFESICNKPVFEEILENSNQRFTRKQNKP